MHGSRLPVVVLGTRPEIIKLAPIIQELQPRVIVYHTGQHFNEGMSDRVLLESGITVGVEHIARVGGTNRPVQVASALNNLSERFIVYPPSVVIVQGDTNAALAGALAGNFSGIPVVHVEAGLRSWDPEMPEEINRRLISTLATAHCAPTSGNVSNLLNEGVPPSVIALTGNTIVETTMAALRKIAISRDDDLLEKPFVVATIHRPENTDSYRALSRILRQLGDVPVKVLMILHPRTRRSIERFELHDVSSNITFLEPQGPSDFLRLVQKSCLIISDSGGLQEECTVIGTPMLVVRRNTERPEAISAGFSRLVTPEMNIAEEAMCFLSMVKKRSGTHVSPFGDGKASERIACLVKLIGQGFPPEVAIAEMRSKTG